MTAGRGGSPVRYPIAIVARRAQLDLETFAQRGGVHPELVRRLVALGLLRAERDAGGRLWFPVDQVAVLARIRRLRAGLQVNYAGLGLVIELLDRIDELEKAMRTDRAVRRPSPWT